MITLREWGPEFEVKLQIRFNKEPDDAPVTKNVFRFTIFNSIYDLDEPGANIPAMWIHGKPDPLNLQMATTMNNELRDWNVPFGNFSVGKWYNVTMKQYQYEVNIFMINNNVF